MRVVHYHEANDEKFWNYRLNVDENNHLAVFF